MIATAEVDFDAHYTVSWCRGVAFYLLGWATETIEPEPFLICDDEDHDHDGECFAYPDEVETRERDDMVRAVMVGDDTVHLVDVDDLSKISEDDYCGGCGQIGCGW